jgi:hypothetical protein
LKPLAHNKKIKKETNQMKIVSLKRTLSSAAMVLVLLSVLVTPAFANTNWVTITAGNVAEAQRGEAIEIPIVISNNGVTNPYGLTIVRFSVDFDSDVLEWNLPTGTYNPAQPATHPWNVAQGSALGFIFTAPGTPAGDLIFNTLANPAVTEPSFTIAILRFRVKDDAPGGTEIGITIDNLRGEMNIDLRTQNNINPGTVTVVIPGGTPTAPDAPTNVSAIAGNAQATVSFTPPSNDGGSPITGYIVTASPGNIIRNADESPFIFTGLANGTEYKFTVAAINAIGTGAPSAESSAVTPTLSQNPPTGIPNISGYIMALFTFLIFSVVLWGFVLPRKLRDNNV